VKVYNDDKGKTTVLRGERKKERTSGLDAGIARVLELAGGKK
jgi:hypothetical protein